MPANSRWDFNSGFKGLTNISLTMLLFLQSFKLVPFARNQAVSPEINMSFTGFQHSGMYSTNCINMPG